MMKILSDTVWIGVITKINITAVYTSPTHIYFHSLCAVMLYWQIACRLV